MSAPSVPLASKLLVCLLASVMAVVGVLTIAATPASARGEQPECDLIASPDGSDDGDGSAEDPLRSPQALVDGLDFGAPGNPAVGCFEPGDYDSDPVTSIETTDVRLTSLGRPARLNGSVTVAAGADRVQLDRLILDGAANPDAGTLTVLGDDFGLADSQVTERHVASEANRATCVRIGTVQSRADRAEITGNRVYDCGLRGTNADNGVAIYHSRGSLVSGNSISSSASRAVSLYPSAIHTRVLNNAIFDNGSAVLFDSAVDDDNGPASALPPTGENIVAANVIRHNGRNSDGQGTLLEEYQVYGRSDTAPGNVLAFNCLSGATGDGNLDPTGFLAGANVQNQSRSQLCRTSYGPGGSSAARPRCLDLTEGSDLANVITVAGSRNDFIAGNGGPDTLTSGPGADCLYGGEDLDTLAGGEGSDLLHGGSGEDTMRAGRGDDLIDARGDGAADEIACGAGADIVYADASDEVADDCERVR